MYNTSSPKDILLGKSQEALEYARQYVHQRIELLKLDVGEKIAKAIVSLVFILIVTLLILSIIAFTLTALALYVGILMNSMFSGFLTVAVFSLCILITILTFGKKLILKPLFKIVLNAIFED